MEVKLEDLLTPCQKCGGTGRLPEQVEHFGIMTRTTLERACDECGGAGGRLTASGKALKEFAWILQTKHPY